MADEDEKEDSSSTKDTLTNGSESSSSRPLSSSTLNEKIWTQPKDDKSSDFDLTLKLEEPADLDLAFKLEKPSDPHSSPNQPNVKLEESSELQSQDSTETLSEEALDAQLKDLIIKHEFDQNFPTELLTRARAFTQGTNGARSEAEIAAGHEAIKSFRDFDELIRNSSPYIEVRSVVDVTDDPSVPVGTFRVFVLGTFFTAVGSGISQFFSLRLPSIEISTFVIQLLAMPLGIAMARWIPKDKHVGFRGWTVNLNPGEFTQKEHLLVAMMGNTLNSPYIVSIVQVLKLDLFYGEKVLSSSILWQVLTLVSSQLLGYGCAGLTRRFLIYPPAMIWPRVLPAIALSKALRRDGESSAWGIMTISRNRFFMVAFAAMFVWFWIPNYLFQALSLFNWTTWFSPASTTVALITGSTCGLGFFNPLPSLDWNIVTSLGDPIVTPLFTLLNFAAGMILSGLLAIPLYFGNFMNGAYLPINSNKIYDNTANVYDVKRVLTSDLNLNVEAYFNYAIPYMSTTVLIQMVAHFVVYIAVPLHIFLYFRRDIAAGIRSAWSRKSREDEFSDIHNRLMSAYPEVPHWWYGIVLLISFVIACIAVSAFPTGMPIWGLLVAIGFTLLLQIPIGMLAAISNVEVSTSILAFLIAGFTLEGQVIGNMIFKMYSYLATSQSLNFVGDLKMAHYCKIPPRWAFAAQLYASMLGGFISLGVNHWSLSNIKGICQEGQAERFVCPHTHKFFINTVLWSAIGPRRLFGSDGPYRGTLYFLPLGIVLPLLVYWGARRWPSSWLRHVNTPIFIAGAVAWAPLNFSYMQGTVVLALFFNRYVKKRYNAWWQKYAYVLTASFSAATGVAALFLFFAFQRWNVKVDWIGNSIAGQGVDQGGFKFANGTTLKCSNLKLQPGESFATGF
ncbi:hypothetical protein CDD80_6855 [Ophiocordyceps camponoti-rufipedis]|uniref:OPT family small oligopeptide transporter n=1 Tax=Ophiocordyceps camponoti-rufipedis TaxID=2004952 RepID=A0A2C5YK41_9HYPO|nr:hypothetical protein CDD80_6855 [Ophiocordyceps camponoti-rufipedis]